MTATTIRTSMLLLAAALACGLAGWALGRSPAARAAAARASAAATADAPAPHTLLAAGPVIALAADGRITLHVDGESLAWVLAEIDRQAGARVATSAVTPARVEAAAPLHPPEPAAAPPAHARPEDVVARVLRGAEPDRFETLVLAQNGGALSADLLKTLYTTDASPRVRLLAFEQSLEGTEADPAARRAALEAARLLPDAAIAQDAARRLQAMDDAARQAAPQVATLR